MADIVLRDHDGEPITYTGIETVTFDAPGSGDRVVYTHGVEQKDFEVGLNLRDGDQTVKAAEGYLLKELIIKKPENLTGRNVRKGETVAGVPGEFIGDTEEIIIGESDGAIPLDFTGESQEVVPSEEGKVISKVIIEVPTNLRPEIIAEGEVIGGVEGTHKGGDHFITYMSDDGTETLYVKPVMYGDTCGDIIALGLVEKPAKEEEGWEHTFLGWSTSIGGAVNSEVFESVTEDKTVYAVFKSEEVLAHGVCGDNLTWRVYPNYQLSITGTGDMYDYEQGNRGWHNNGFTVTSVSMSEGLTRIGNHAFNNLSSVTSITIPSSVKHIGSGAFYSFKGKSITIPDGVLTIGGACFNMSALTSITIPSSVTYIGNNAFAFNSLFGSPGISSATFKDTTTWYVTQTEGATSGTTLSSSNLSNTSTAATYLKSTYLAYHWYKT